jgi:hypothetical protein
MMLLDCTNIVMISPLAIAADSVELNVTVCAAPARITQWNPAVVGIVTVEVELVTIKHPE